MRHGALICVLVGSAAGLVGCGWQAGSASDPQGGLAVVDLDEVAKSLGANARLAEMVKMRETSLNNDLKQKKSELEGDLNDKVKELKEKYTEADPISPDDAKKLRAESISANATLQQFRTQAQVNLNSYTEALKQQFRAEIKPIAQEIATAKGFSVVIPKNDGLLLSVAPGNDITNDVILALQSRNQKAAADAKANPTKATAAKSTKKKSDEPKTVESPHEAVQE